MRSPMRSPLRSPARSPARNSIPLPKWRPRRTLIDLYNEKDRTQWYWKVSAVISTFMIMIGFLIFPSAFTTKTDLAVNPTSTSVVAGIFIALGYILSAALYFLCKSWLFQLDCILGPCLSSCVFGLFNIIYNLTIRPKSASLWNASSISALAVATALTLVYTVFALLTFRKIYAVRSRDAMHRHNPDGEALLPEDEMQRQQLLRLLLQRDGKKVSSEISRSTYRIDLPDMPGRVTTHLLAPQNVYAHDAGRSRSRSAPIDPPFQDRPMNQTSPEPPSVHIQEPTLSDSSTFPQFTQNPTMHTNDYEQNSNDYPQNPFPSTSDYEQNSNSYSPNPFPQTSDYQTETHDFAQDPYPPSNSYSPHPHDLGIEGIVNTRPRAPSLPLEKQEQLTRQLSSRHPAERPDYHIVEPPVPKIVTHYTPQTVEEINRLSRESRQKEIELEDRGRDKKRRPNVEIDGVEFTPRIQRVTTDGWSKPSMDI